METETGAETETRAAQRRREGGQNWELVQKLRNGSIDLNGNENGGRGRRKRKLGNSPYHGRSRVVDQALSFPTRHHLCRQQAALAGSQKLWAQDLAPFRQCNEEKTESQGQEQENGD